MFFKNLSRNKPFHDSDPPISVVVGIQIFIFFWQNKVVVVALVICLFSYVFIQVDVFSGLMKIA